MIGKCVKCGKDVKLGTDGSCKNCNAEICWECWVEAGHECPNCGKFDGKRDTANAHALAEERSDDSQQRVVGGKVER